MNFVDIHIIAKNESVKVGMLDWLIDQVANSKKGAVSMRDFLERYMDEMTLEDNDVFDYHVIGWNFMDMHDLFRAKQESSNLEIPKPNYRFWKW